MVWLTISILTLCWVLAILASRSKECKFWRDPSRDRRVTCGNCVISGTCERCTGGNTKPCSTYTGPERRRVVRIGTRSSQP